MEEGRREKVIVATLPSGGCLILFMLLRLISLLLARARERGDKRRVMSSALSSPVPYKERKKGATETLGRFENLDLLNRSFLV